MVSVKNIKTLEFKFDYKSIAKADDTQVILPLVSNHQWQDLWTNGIATSVATGIAESRLLAIGAMSCSL